MAIKTKSIISHSPKDTLGLGARIAKYLRKGDIVCLFGGLGSGKTVLTKGIASGLGADKKKVISPTFVLLRQYSGAKLPLFHFDLYRLVRHSDIMFLGCEEYFYDEGVTVVEWADRLGYLLPEEHLKIELFISGDKKRLLKFNAAGKRYKQLLNSL